MNDVPKSDRPKKATETLTESNSTLRDAEPFSQTVGPQETRSAGTGDSCSFQAGDSLGKYEVQRKLGQGGMGAVYLAFDPMIQRQVAIKVLPPHIASQPKALDRFLSEARATGKLNHANVVAIYDIDKEGDAYFIVMELVNGGSVADFVEQHPDLDWQKACRLAIDACDGLGAAHAVNLVHRDIKPENLMVNEDQVVKVVDFGLSKLVDTATEGQLAITTAGQILGTPHFMSPEQFQGQNVDARSDVYSMGATFYTLLIGEPPFSQATNIVSLMTAHLQQPPPDPADKSPDIPAGCSRIVAKAMAENPADRFVNADQMAVALREVLAATDEEATMQTYRPLRSAVVVEPSKMQAMMLGNALKKVGVTEVKVCDSSAGLSPRKSSPTPDLFVTAMQLPDGKGVELLGGLRKNPSYRDTVLVLNSSELEIQRMVEFVGVGPWAVVSKKTKPDQLLAALHCCTFLDCGSAATVDVSTLRYGFICETPRIPDPIAQFVRQSSLLDFQVTTFDELAGGRQFSGEMDLVFALRKAGAAANDTWIYADLLSRAKVTAKALAALQVDGDQLTLRAVQRSDFMAVSRCNLDDERLRRLVGLCQLS